MYSPPDRPLIVKCTFDKWHKRITFSSARNCSYDLLRRKVEQCFSLYGTSYAVSYKDDDGEITNIATDPDLIEAIQYFQAGDDAPISSAASILSGRSFGARKVTLRVNITVDYDGPSLSDTSSLASLEEFKGRNGSQQSFSFGAPSVDLDDDSVTVSSRDPGTSSARNGRTLGESLHSIPKQRSFASSDNRKTSVGLGERPMNGQNNTQQNLSSLDVGSQRGYQSSANNELTAAAERYPADPSAVFERLKLSETLRDDSSSVDFDSLAASERGAAWLRDQNQRAIRSMLGALPEPSDSDGFSLSLNSQDDALGGDSLGGDLALERDPRGKYYYTYTSGSSSQFQESDDDGQNGNAEADAYVQEVVRGPRPTSMQLNWLAAQRIESAENRRSNHSDLRSLSIQEEIHGGFPEVIDKDLFPFLPVPGPAREILTDCSNCGLLLDAIRYVCSTCGEKAPVGSSGWEKGKDKEPNSSPVSAYTYPPETHRVFSSPNSSSSQTYIGSSESLHDSQRYKPLPSIPSASLPSLHSTFASRTHMNAPSSPSSQHSMGYELCSACLESVGIHHAIEAGLAAPGSSPGFNNMSPSHDDPQRALQWRRAAPKKGQLRHAYQEKVWGHLGWEDVVLDEAQISQCSTCTAVTERKRYKCASCSKMHLCRACYSQVHELHPSHAFLIVPDKPVEVSGTSDFHPSALPDPHEELSLKHPGVKCAHCLLDIVGARFHCAICDSVDICSNCESVGLPGNLDSADGGHNSSHILIKIPYPLETTELQNASRRAVDLWTARDAASVGFSLPRSKAESEISSYAHTLIASGTRDGLSHSPRDHRLFCNGCGHLITGTRYQCAHCPSKPSGYSLCSSCEPRSYLIHDPMHIFFKLPRPVYQQLESPFPMLPPLYKIPAGPAPTAPKTNDPKAYLGSLVHSSAICDRCMTCIEGEWFRCAYCAVDLCDACEEVDTHDDTHVFLVFKSLVDMQLFKNFANLDNPAGSPPVISYPVYR
ncbi:hypothetical protein GALMADRAFT_240994 [Galerina marginata CBS 339.88]|uniref:ZZ-type domain-containing protein n=1 Tax=Galerina marginata (strain CBS 339.88) TaxID=685588 RepID=A0A067TBW1_GALM3|nr:hypothetical protein GALMADRAFT_240994 [Galerina marginata CBS 339.88]